MAITLRGNKSQALTHAELDGNFTDLDTRVTANKSTLDNSVVKSINSNTPSSGAVTLDTDDIGEGSTNLYYTNTRADARIAAADITDLSNVDYSGTPTTNHVLTWDGDSWVSAAPPGLGGGEANNGNNLGSTGAQVFSSKVGQDLQFRRIIGTAPIVATENTNDITLTFAPSADVNNNTQKIINVVDPTNAQDAATKNYVDDFLPLAGGTMSGALNMGTQRIVSVSDPSGAQDAATKNYVDTNFVADAGGTMSGNLAMGTNKVTGLGTPVSGTDAATKAYVDGEVSSLSTTLTISDGSATDNVTVGSDTLTFAGTANEVETTVTDNQVSIGLPTNVDVAGDLTAGGDFTVTGNLTVSGTTTTINTATLQVDDALIGLQNSLGANPNTNDLGLIMERGTTGANAAIIFDESTDKFVVGTTTNTAADTGNITMDISGASASTLQLHTLEATSVAGTLQTAAQANITSVGTLTSLTSSGTIDADTFTTDGLTIVDNNITSSRTNDDIVLDPAGTGKVAVIGNVSATEFQGIATSAQYADLAEIYVADKELVPGTVVVVGGEAEITTAGPDAQYLAGVISTAPAYLMNSAVDGEAVALVGRVPVRVVGSINKGEAVFATYHGKASANGQGPIVGIALETNSDLDEKSVECLLKV
jgi:hypothetical protein